MIEKVCFSHEWPHRSGMHIWFKGIINGKKTYCLEKIGNSKNTEFRDGENIWESVWKRFKNVEQNASNYWKDKDGLAYIDADYTTKGEQIK